MLVRSVLLWGLVLVSTTALAAERPPNIVLIFADDVGREVLGCYGGRSYETPHIDALAVNGLRMTYCFSMPVCHPSRVCLLTGRYPAALGSPKWGTFPESENSRTFAAVLKRAGYATAVAGKWQLQLLKDNPAHPHQLGFDEYSVFGWHEGPRYHEPMIYENGNVRDLAAGKYGPDLYVEFLLDFMRRNRDRPFLAWYSMALCHDVTDDIDSPPPFYRDDRWMTYAEMVASMDEQVGRVLKGIDELGLRENTVVLFTTDNGTAKSSYLRVEGGKMVKEPVYSEAGGRRIRGGKGELTDWGTRVPLLIRWPGRTPAGRAHSDLIDFSDFLPTLAELAGAELPGTPLDGRSFAPRITGAGAGPRAWVYSESKGRFWVRNRRFKLYDDGRLYHMERDPDERQPLGDATPPAELQRAMERLRDSRNAR